MNATATFTLALYAATAAVAIVLLTVLLPVAVLAALALTTYGALILAYREIVPPGREDRTYAAICEMWGWIVAPVQVADTGITCDVWAFETITLPDVPEAPVQGELTDSMAHVLGLDLLPTDAYTPDATPACGLPLPMIYAVELSSTPASKPARKPRAKASKPAVTTHVPDESKASKGKVDAPKPVPAPSAAQETKAPKDDGRRFVKRVRGYSLVSGRVKVRPGEPLYVQTASGRYVVEGTDPSVQWCPKTRKWIG